MSEANTTDLSAQLYIELQRLTGVISIFRSYAAMVGFIPKTHYAASHVAKQEQYSAEQWLSDYFANKIGLIPNFLDMNQCVPQSPDAAAKTLDAFLAGLQELPSLIPREGGDAIGLFDALREDIRSATKSRKLMQGRTIYVTDVQKELALGLIDDIADQYEGVVAMLRLLKLHYESVRESA